MPEAVFQDLGNRLTQALVQGDFALYRGVMTLPLRVVPLGDLAYVLTDEAALQQDFDLYHRSIRTAGVTDIYREVERVQPEGTGFRVFCRVHIMARAHRVAEPHLSEMLLLPAPESPRPDGISDQTHGLRIAEIVSTSEHIDWTLGRKSLDPGSGLI